MIDSNSINSYKDLTVWQRAVELVVTVYELTEQYPKSELYGLTSQTRRAAVSIPSNIAEGRRRGSRKEYCQFLLIAYGSGAELETHLVIAQRLPFGERLDFSRCARPLDETMKMLNAMIAKLRT
ncbi:MAG: four helix bundle protein [bacterium]|nr:four helix bundle protein [bacterium]